MWPASLCDEWGNVLLLKRATSLDVAEAIGKGMSVVTKRPDPYASCGMATYLMKVGDMKRVLVPGTLSQALVLGQGIRRAREQGQDPVTAAAALARGWVLFQGVVSKREWENTGGYQIGTTEIRGTGADAGHSFRVWFKNEHHLSWKDGQVFVSSPDLLSIVAAETAEPITNTYLAEGQAVAVIGMAAHPRLRTAAGIAVLGPRHFGFDLTYRPIEEWLN